MRWPLPRGGCQAVAHLGAPDCVQVIAAGRLGARAVGYELDRDLCAQAKQARPTPP